MRQKRRKPLVIGKSRYRESHGRDWTKGNFKVKWVKGDGICLIMGSRKFGLPTLPIPSTMHGTQ